MKLSEITRYKIIPVAVIESAENAVPAAEALLSGGIGVIEVTMRTGAALESIRRLKSEAPGITAGAGTVLTLDQCRACVDAGAEFIVSPGFDPGIAEWCLKNGVAVIPGCVTPTEIMAATSLGITTLKFFPANVYGGIKAMKALSAPFPGVSFVPTGGVNAANLGEYCSAPFVAAAGGSWLCSKADIAAGNYEKIARLSREAMEIIQGTSGGRP